MDYFDSQHHTLLVDPVTPRDHVRGPAVAAVTLVEYGDFACPSSADAYAIVKALLENRDYLRLVFRANPRSHRFPHATEAAEAAEAAAAQGKFWQMHDGLFENQSTLSSEEIRKCAARAGLDLARFETELKAGVYRAVVQAQELSGWHSHVLSTPTFFINGIRLDDSLATIPAAVAQALREQQRVPQIFRSLTVRSLPGDWRQSIAVGSHQLVSDLPTTAGGSDAGASPYDLLLAALGASTGMTIGRTAEQHQIPLRQVEVRLSQSRTAEGHLFRRSIDLSGDLNEQQRASLLTAADDCPVARTLGRQIKIETRLGPP